MMKSLLKTVLLAIVSSICAAQVSGNANTSSTTDAGTASTNAAQSDSVSGSATANSSRHTGTVIPAVLTKSVDSKKAKIGDEIVAKVASDVRSAGQIVVPRDSKLIGKITEAKARTRGDATSALGINFDRAVLKNGTLLRLSSTIQALIAAPQQTASPIGNDDGYGSGGAVSDGSDSGSLLGNVAGVAGSTAGGVANSAGSTVGGVAGSPGSPVASPTGAQSNAIITTQTTGVVGIKGLELSTAVESETSGSVFVSNSKSVKIDSGSRLLVNVSAASPAQSQSEKPNTEPPK